MRGGGARQRRRPGRCASRLEGHHPPDYAVGSRVLVFLNGSRSALGVAPDRARPRRDSRARAPRATRCSPRCAAMPGCAACRDRGERIAQLEDVRARQPRIGERSRAPRGAARSDRARAGAAFDAADVARVAALARDPKTPATLAPGLVVLLAAIRSRSPSPRSSWCCSSAANPQTRAAAARVVGQRRGPIAVAALQRGACATRALAVRLTAQRALDGRFAMP